MAVETYEQPDGSDNYNTFGPVAEAATKVLLQTSVQFAPHAQATPDMTVALDTGRVFDATTKKVTDVLAQNTATITAPTSDPRCDIIYVDRDTGTVGVATGTEAASPVDPAVPDDKAPIARINLTTGTTEIGNADLDDLRISAMAMPPGPFGTMAKQDADSVAITGGTITGITDLDLGDGGTGASNAVDARSNLGLGTMATQNANSVAITGGTVTGITDLAVADGGTGATTPADARTNLGAAASGANSDITSLNGVTSINGGPLAGFRNVLINGNFDIWQRGTSFSTPSPDYTADRWVAHYQPTGGGAGTSSRQAFTLGQTDVPGEPEFFYRFNQTSAPSLNPIFYQRVEDVRTFAGQTITMSFFAKVGSGTLNVFPRYRQNFGTGGAPSSQITINGAAKTITTSWQKFTETFNISSISGKTLGSNGDSFFTIELLLPHSAVFAFDVARVQAEYGSTATEFERRPIGAELALCQRYYQRFSGVDDFNYLASGFIRTTNVARGVLQFPTTMRATPTMSSDSSVGHHVLHSGGAELSTSVAYLNPTRDGCLIDVTVTGTPFSVGQGAILRTLNSANKYTEADAEL